MRNQALSHDSFSLCSAESPAAPTAATGPVGAAPGPAANFPAASTAAAGKHQGEQAAGRLHLHLLRQQGHCPEGQCAELHSPPTPDRSKGSHHRDTAGHKLRIGPEACNLLNAPASSWASSALLSATKGISLVRLLVAPKLHLPPTLHYRKEVLFSAALHIATPTTNSPLQGWSLFSPYISIPPHGPMQLLLNWNTAAV